MTGKTSKQTLKANKLFDSRLKELTIQNSIYNKFMDKVKQAARDTAMVVKRNCNGWFQHIKNLPDPLIAEQDNLLHKLQKPDGAPEAVMGAVGKYLKSVQM